MKIIERLIFTIILASSPVFAFDQTNCVPFGGSGFFKPRDARSAVFVQKLRVITPNVNAEVFLRNNLAWQDKVGVAFNRLETLTMELETKTTWSPWINEQGLVFFRGIEFLSCR